MALEPWFVRGKSVRERTSRILIGEDLAAAAVFEVFAALQGACGVYHTSGLNGFETIESVARAWKDSMEKLLG